MSEKLSSSNEAEQQNENPYEGMSRETLDAIVAAKGSVDPESSTPSGDLRTAVREALEESGDSKAFRRVYDMNNLELNSFVDGVSGEMKTRRIDELKAIIDAYDSNDSFGDRRTALREALEASGDSKAFRRVYDMNNLDITSFVNDARRQLQEETSLGEEEALNEAYTEYEEREGTPYDVDKGRVKNPEEARVLATIEDISRRVKSDPEAAKRAGIYDKLREVLGEIDSALAKAKASEIGEPKDVDAKDSDEIGEPKDADADEIGEPKDTSVDGKDKDEIGEPKDADVKDEADKIGEPKDTDVKDSDEIGEPKDVVLVDEEGAPDEDREPGRRPNLFRRAYNRVYVFFATHNGPAGALAYGLERFRDSRKAKVVAAIGALGLVGLGIAGRHYGWFDGGGHHGSTPNPADTHSGTGNGNGQAPGEFTTPAPATPEIPNGGNYAHPWNWMKAAMENGSVKPPKGMGPEQALHYYGEKAAAAGHKVEWYNLPNGMEAVRVDGQDGTDAIAKVFEQQFAK